VDFGRFDADVLLELTFDLLPLGHAAGLLERLLDFREDRAVANLLRVQVRVEEIIGTDGPGHHNRAGSRVAPATTAVVLLLLAGRYERECGTQLHHERNQRQSRAHGELQWRWGAGC